MYEVGLVESVNEKRGTAKVVFDRRSACDKCKMCLVANGDKMKVYVEVKNALNAKPGDRVGVQMNDAFVLRAAFIVYIIPVILIGAGLAIFRKFSDLILLGVVAVALLLGVAIGVTIDRSIRKKGTFAPKMVAIIDQEDNAPPISQEENEEGETDKTEE